MKHPNPLMLLRIAQGDAYGMATEYLELPTYQKVKDQALRFERYGKHPAFDIKAGHYTDDTQMSIAVSETLLGYNPHRELGLLKAQFADAFVKCYKRDPRLGYSKNFQAFLETAKDGIDFMTRIASASRKNGAAMRAVPIGLLADPGEVWEVARVQAELTHDTEEGLLSSICVGLMSHYAFHTDEPLRDLPEWLAGELGSTSEFRISLQRWEDDFPVEGEGVAISTVEAVMTLLATETTLLGIAKKALEWGGDTDSVLAIAWGIASARMREDLPAFFGRDLERGPYGHDFLVDLGSKLMAQYAEAGDVPGE
jgi:ADP-ribosyl-[dinitrogen reductase] hydrolase